MSQDDKEFTVPAKHGAGFIVRRGETIRIVSVQGHQICDFVCFNRHNPGEKLSTGETIIFNTLAGNGSIHISVGSRIYSNLHNPMFEFIEDRANGVHDLQYAPCSNAIYVALGHVGHRNCRDNLTEAVKPYGLDYLDIPDPVNLFQNTRAKLDGTIDYQPTAGKAGDYVALRALMDCIAAVSACPFDLAVGGVAGPRVGPLKVEFVDR